MISILSWLATLSLGFLGFSGAASTFNDLLVSLDRLLDAWSWPILVTLSCLYANRMRRWRDQ